MKHLSILFLFITSIIANADTFTVNPSYIGNDAVAYSIFKQSQQVVNRDRRHESGSAILLGIISNHEGADIKTPNDSESKIAIWEGHEVDHGLGDGLIINDPNYYVPAEKTSVTPEVKSETVKIEENSIKPEEQK